MVGNTRKLEVTLSCASEPPEKEVGKKRTRNRSASEPPEKESVKKKKRDRSASESGKKKKKKRVPSKTPKDDEPKGNDGADECSCNASSDDGEGIKIKCDACEKMELLSKMATGHRIPPSYDWLF